MQALRTKNPLTESFLVQLDVDLEGSGLDIQFSTKLSHSKAMVSVRTGFLECMLTEGQGEVPINTDSVKCSPLFEIRQSQTQGQNGGIQASIEKPLHTTTDIPMDFSNITTFETAAIPQRPRVSPRPPANINSASVFANERLNAEAANGNEMDTSPDPSGESTLLSRPHSNHPTPSSTSNKGSSHTPFTPPQFDDGPSGTYRTTSANMSPNLGTHSIYQSSDTFGSYSAQFAEQGKEGPQGMNTPFAMPASWDYSNDGSANTGTGLKPHNPANVSGQAAAMMPIPTGMTPISVTDVTWQGTNIMEGNEWMYGDWDTTLHGNHPTYGS
jgi:hypothetical protein